VADVHVFDQNQADETEENETESQVQLTTSNAFCIVQRATAQTKQEIFVVMVLLKLLRFFKPAGLTEYIFLFLCSFHLLIWNYRVSFYTYEGAVSSRSSAQVSCREEVGVSFVAKRQKEVTYSHRAFCSNI
jgi:hypothetical protein